MKERRLVRVAVSFELLRDMMYADYKTLGAIKSIKGLPSDAEMVGDSFDVTKLEAYLFFSHESFDRVPRGEPIPMLPVCHDVDYTASDLLRKWYEGMERLRTRDDAVLDTIVGKELDEVFHDTYEYLEDLFK